MVNRSKMGRIMGGLLIGGLLLGGTGLALANGSGPSFAVGNQIRSGMFGRMELGPHGLDGVAIESVLDKLVAGNQLTQAQADQIVARHEQSQAQRMQQREPAANMTPAEREAWREQLQTTRVDVLTQLVNEGIITKDQVYAIHTALREQRGMVREQSVSAALQRLVEEKVISATQSAAIDEELAAVSKDRQADMEQMRNMTAEQRRLYIEQNRPARPLANLVTSGVLTQEQADQVRKALGQSDPGPGKGMHRGQRGSGGQSGPR